MKTEPVRLLLGANDAYAMPLTVAAHSALRHLSRDREVQVCIMADHITPANRSRICAALERAHPRVSILWKDAELAEFDGLEVGHYSLASVARLLAPQVFGPEVGRVLYLDSDLTVEADVAPLWDLDLGDTAIWAVQNGDAGEFMACVGSKFPEVAAPPDAVYFNSGVLLINLPAWRSQQVSERTFAFMRRHGGALSFPDQDALNAVAAGDWGRLPPRWNKQVIRLGQPEAAPRADPGIIHYSAFKPWSPDYTWPCGMVFHRAYLHSGWDGRVTALRRFAGLAGGQFLRRNLARVGRRLGLG